MAKKKVASKKSTATKTAKKKSVESDPKKIRVQVYQGDNEINEHTAKKLLGWEEEPDGLEWKNYDLKFNQKKVRLKNNDANRPLRLSLAKRWAAEMGRKKWMLNGETITFDWNGKIVSGQHRLVGVIIAEDERIHKLKYEDCTGGVSFPCIVVRGVDPESADTTDLGQKRSLGDVLFRRREFGEDMSEREQKKYTDQLAHAVRLVWLRMGGKKVSDAPSFPPSEALDFLELHPRIMDSVDHVMREDGGNGADGRKIRTYVTLGYAAGLHYLMSTCGTDVDDGEVSFDFEDKANEFWTLLASGAGLEANDPILHVRNLIIKIDQASGSSRDQIVGIIVKGWNLWVDGENATAKKVAIRKTKDEETGKMVLAEFPRIGGLDTDLEEEWEDEE